MRIRALFALTTITALFGCAPRAEPATARQLRARAAFELGCPPEYLALVRIDETTGGVAGCGRRAVYVETCDARGRCSWRYDRDAGAPAFPGLVRAGDPPRSSPYPGGTSTPPRASPYSGAPGTEQSQADPEWRARVPRLLRDDPGF